MNPGYLRMIEMCRRDRDWLLDKYCVRGTHCTSIPALVIDEIIQDILQVDLVAETLAPDVLGQTSYDERLISLNDNPDLSGCPNADREGIQNFTKAHEVGHWRVFDHEAKIRAEIAEGQMRLPLLPERPAAMIVCRAPWDRNRQKLTKEQRWREFEADTYARVFLVPETQLIQLSEIKELIALGASGKAVSEKAIWRGVYLAAGHFYVSPSMMKNVLKGLGVVVVAGNHIQLSAQRQIPVHTDVDIYPNRTIGVGTD